MVGEPDEQWHRVSGQSGADMLGEGDRIERGAVREADRGHTRLAVDPGHLHPEHHRLLDGRVGVEDGLDLGVATFSPFHRNVSPIRSTNPMCENPWSRTTSPLLNHLSPALKAPVTTFFSDADGSV